MSYILCLGFRVNVYKKFPKIRVFLNDIFIDEFLISGVKNSNYDGNELYKILSDSFQNLKFKTLLHPNAMIFYKEIQTPLSNKVFLKFFELDENYINSLAKHKLKIQVFNDDNNFTNGFLTKSTFIALRIASIIPKKILIDHLNFMSNHLSFMKESRCNHKSIEEICNDYIDKIKFFDLISYATCGKESINPLIWHNDKGSVNRYLTYEWVGISGYTELSFDKTVISYDKFNIEKFMVSYTFLYLLGNKYVQYANQRNTD